MPVKTTSPKTVVERKPSVKVSNTEIIIGQTYEVVPKMDRDAPLGFQQFSTTKYLHEGNKEIRGIFYDEDSRMWDSGFEINSNCNKRIPEEERKSLVLAYNKLIKEPYQKFYNVEITPTNDEFWNGYLYEIWTGKTFNTEDPKELFDLYNAIKQGRVCEIGERDPELQRSAKYCIKNREKVISLQEQKAQDKMEAYFTFMTALNAVKDENDDLYTILEWIQVTNVRGADKETLKRTITKMFENERTGYDTSRRFLDAYNMISDPVQKEEMEMFSIISKLQHKRKLEFKRQQYYLEGTLLGSSIKGAAKSAILNPELKEQILSAYEETITD